MLSEVLKHDVFPALGCTEPIAVAYAASVAAKEVGGVVKSIEIVLDPGVYKNGFAVTIPNTNGERGNGIAGVLGALIARPDLKMEVMSQVTEPLLEQARALIQDQKVQVICERDRKRLYIAVNLTTDCGTAKAVIEGTHKNLVSLACNGKNVFQGEAAVESKQDTAFRDELKQASIESLVDEVACISQEDAGYIKRGIDMNLLVCEAGFKLGRVGQSISELVAKKQREDTIVASCEIMTSSAVDARMGGVNLPVMSSGGSGNQGIIAILVPYLVGKHNELDEAVVIRSIALSHLMNSYIKCFTGDLSPLCGCAISAGVGAAVALVYQQAGKDMNKIMLATNNLISDLGGMLCDGAKEGCSLKVASSTNSAIRAAHMAMNDHGITQLQGFVGTTTEDTIRNLSKIGVIGMSLANDEMLNIMIDKAAGSQ